MLQEHCKYHGMSQWSIGELQVQNTIQTTPYSKLSTCVIDPLRIRVYYQSADAGTIQECVRDFSDPWLQGCNLHTTPPNSKLIDNIGSTYAVGWLPSILVGTSIFCQYFHFS